MADDPTLIRLAGADPVDARPFAPFAPVILDFLAALSGVLRADPGAQGLGDVQSFAFWCRRAHLERLRKAQDGGRLRLGRGLVFHVAPGNVPINFAFSLAFGLLAGNANIVRVPSKDSVVVDMVAGAIRGLLRDPAFAALAASQTLVRYDAAATDWSRRFCARADARLIWGGDSTIAALRALAVPPRCVDVVFADRTSLAVLSAQAVLAASAAELDGLAQDFFNDTYLMDQNACSSPHLLVWLGAAESEAAARRFWSHLAPVVAARYGLAPVQAVEQYSAILAAILDGEPLAAVHRLGAGLTVADLNRLPDDMAERRGRHGLFRQIGLENLGPVAPLLDGRYQTLTYYGLDAADLGDFVTGHRLAGIDRIVPVGRALDMDVVWDGYDLIGQLSRIIDLR